MKHVLGEGSVCGSLLGRGMGRGQTASGTRERLRGNQPGLGRLHQQADTAVR